VHPGTEVCVSCCHTFARGFTFPASHQTVVIRAVSRLTGHRVSYTTPRKATANTCVFDHVERTTMNIIYDWGTDVNLDRRLRRRGPIQKCTRRGHSLSPSMRTWKRMSPIYMVIFDVCQDWLKSVKMNFVEVSDIAQVEDACCGLRGFWASFGIRR
jgi:hypothetical protein